MSVQWSHDNLSRGFTVSNGVRQGGVLSPFLFAIYLDSLIDELSLSGVGCRWWWMFTGVFCFADDIVLLAPCTSALRHMLSPCSAYATSHGLIFNLDKTQLICFRKHTYPVPNDIIEFNGVHLNFSDTILHLGHLISFDLSDQEDIFRINQSINQKANLLMNTFRFSDPFVLTYLFKAYCLSLSLWKYSMVFIVKYT